MRWMQFPREIFIGENLLERVDEIVSKLFSLNLCVLISGRKTYELFGRKIKHKLSSRFDVHTYLVEKSNYERISEIRERIKDIKNFFIIAVGGGKVIDVAKVLSKELNVDFISIPTCASHDGISSSFASIFKDNRPHSMKARAPYAIIADLNILKEAPYRLTASGCGDLLAKFSAIEDWKLARRIKRESFSEYAANLALMAARTVVKHRKKIRNREISGIRKLVKALVASGISISIANSSRPASGAEHKFAHALDIIKPDNGILHGEKVSIATIFFMYLHKKDWKWLKNILEELGCPTNIYDIGIDKEEFIDAMIKAKEIKPERYTILEYRNLNRNDIVEICKHVGIF